MATPDSSQPFFTELRPPKRRPGSFPRSSVLGLGRRQADVWSTLAGRMGVDWSRVFVWRPRRRSRRDGREVPRRTNSRRSAKA